MMFPHTVTIYNKYKSGNTEKWQRTVLQGVFWNSSKGAVIRKTGVASADGVQLIIPFTADQNKAYCKPQEFAKLQDKSNHWTLQSKDMIVKGILDYEIAKSSSELAQFDDVLMVSNVDTRDFGGNLAHWEVSGK